VDNSNVPIPNSNFKRDLPQRTFEFAQRVVKLCQVLGVTPGVGRTLANQLLRSGTAIGANVEEGQAAQSRADFLSKLSIACKEARETHYWLRLLASDRHHPRTLPDRTARRSQPANRHPYHDNQENQE
jgi:four helix bundle protein